MQSFRHNTNNPERRAISRRDFLWLTSMSAAGLLVGCATNPVTGKSQLMLMSEQDEIGIDKKHSPHQFSNDYGVVQDKRLNSYIQRTGRRMIPHTHRPQMPYTFQAVNATYVNAYAFPGGSIAATRGILLSMESEAELAALLGHELGHVNARHTAEQMSKGTLTQVFMVGVAIAASTQGREWGQLAQVAGMVGGSALLAKYSRDNEREADALGMEYLAKSQYSPQGMVDLMDMLKGLSKHKPGLSQTLFSTHPMSTERYNTTIRRATAEYKTDRNNPLHRERFMDMTARLRKIEGAIERMQQAELAMAKKNFPRAEDHLGRALEKAPNDYTGLVMMSKCLMAQNKNGQAQRYADKAKKIYPEEAQAHHFSGLAAIRQRRYAAAMDGFNSYDRLLPGNPNTAFLKGRALEGMGRRKDAARQYYRHLQQVKQGKSAKYAHNRLVQWGYLK